MRWYSARLLYECLLDPMPKRNSTYPFFEEKIVVFQAGQRKTVPVRLSELAKRGEHEYEAAAGNQVRWVFREVLEVQDIMTNKGLADGTEVYFRWWRRPGPPSLQDDA